MNTTVQRPLNELTRTVVAGIAGALSGAPAIVHPPFDEPLRLGYSLEAQQLCEDAGRILQLEARLNDVMDPLAGSYYVEHLTDEIEHAAWEELEKVEKMGGAVAAISAGYIQQQLAKGAYEYHRQVETGERSVVGVNCFTGENELEVTVNRVVPEHYDHVKLGEAEERQKANLAKVKRARDNKKVSRLLNDLKKAAKKENENLVPYLIACVKSYATLQEMCDVLREIWGEYHAVGLQ